MVNKSQEKVTKISKMVNEKSKKTINGEKSQVKVRKSPKKWSRKSQRKQRMVSEAIGESPSLPGLKKLL